jgi:GTPase SAR1 family protein
MALAGTIIVQSNWLRRAGSVVSQLLFRRIEISLVDNQILIPKVQTFLKKKAFGGSETVIENGNDKVKTGCMFTVSPFSLIKSHYSSETRISIYLVLPWQKTHSFLEYLNRLDNSDNSVRFYTMSSSSGRWQKAKTLERVWTPRLYSEDMFAQISANIERFLDSRRQYQNLGKTHKLTMLFYGASGTGKTSLVKQLAMEYGRDVYIIDPSHYFCDMNDLQKTIINSSVLSPCQGGILLFEDVDRYFATLYAKQQRPNISNFLNFLDGLCTPENIIIIMTANYKGDIPDPIRRDGRIDLTISFPYVNEEIKSKICQAHQIDPNLIRIEGRVTSSELIKKIEMSKSELSNSQTLCITGEITNPLTTVEESVDSLSILNNS